MAAQFALLLFSFCSLPVQCQDYGLPSWKSSKHDCDRANGMVWCDGRCLTPGMNDDHTLSCIPENIETALPTGFAWGSATASYQIEGAVNEDGRGATIWDVFSHTKGKIYNGDTGDVADDHYHRWVEDVELISGLGLTHYRCSIAWSRILPNGVGEVNQLGLQFYDALFDRLLARGVQPFVTLYHWDLPYSLEEAGGWLNPKTIDAYLEYAEVVFRHFGRRVNLWLTFNEPNTFVRQGFSEGNHAPGRCSDRSRCEEGDSFTEPYLVAHNVLRAHARAVALFRILNATSNGSIGITLNGEWAQPFPSEPDSSAPERYMESQIGWFADPIMHGEYPESMRARLGGRLPQFEEKEKALLVGSWDFFGFNFYNALYVSAFSGENAPYWQQDLGLFSSGSDGTSLIGLQGESPWLFETPGGLRNILLWINKRYLHGSLPLYITENGCSAPHESETLYPAILHDPWRVAYFFEYLEAMAAAVVDGVPVVGYFAWSLLDNFEWADGYHMRFGIHYVDYTTPERTRHRKTSANWYAALLKTLSQETPMQGDLPPLASLGLLAPVLCCVVGGMLWSFLKLRKEHTREDILREIQFQANPSKTPSSPSKYSPI